MRQVGILGGTFDPPHRGHLALARAALASGQVERVLLVPARMPPHKQRPDISPAAARLAMTELLVAVDPRLTVSDIEVGRAGPSFTIDTVQELRRRNPDERYRLIVGADMALELGTWREIEKLLQLAPPLVAERPGVDLPADLAAAGPGDISAAGRGRLQAGRFSLPPQDISSTAIRAACARNEDVSALLTEAVAQYVREKGLYRTGG